jgi:UDP-3-O-[3-hydroxymyristoyl] glucosamine N-acyltransferase
MSYTLAEIADRIGGRLKGDGQIEIKGVSGLQEAQPGEISFLASRKYQQFLNSTRASAVILPEREEIGLELPAILHVNPYFAFACAVKLFHPEKPNYPVGIHPTATLEKSVQLGKNVCVGPYTVIEGKVEIGDDCTILAGCFIGESTKIGKEVFLYPKVTVYHSCQIGNQVIIHSGAVIGSDGFGFAFEKGKHHKIPQIGTVVIEDDVEIGANCTIDRAALGVTRIGRGTKLDNLVHLGHSVEVGENSILVAQVGIGGSTILGKYVTLAGQAGLVGHITLGDYVTVGAQGGVTKSIPAGTTVSGYPAREHKKAKKIEARLSHLPEYIGRIKELEKEVRRLKKNH